MRISARKGFILALVVAVLQGSADPEAVAQAPLRFMIGPAKLEAMVSQSPQAAGMAVRWLQKNTALGRAGVPAGSLIVRYGDVRVTTAAEIVAAINRYGDRAVEIEVLLPLQPGENTRKRDTFRIAAVPKPDDRNGPPSQPRAFVLCVVGPAETAGQGDYAVAKQSATDIKDSLKNEPVGDYSEVTLVEDARDGLTWSAIQGRLTEIGGRATPNDAVIVFFIGHGGFDPQNRTDSSLGHFLEIGRRQALGRPARQDFVWRRDFLAAIPRHVRLRGLITDSCGSMTVFPKREGMRVVEQRTWTSDGPITLWQRLLLYSKGTVDLNGCSERQMAWENRHTGTGLFTSALLETTRRNSIMDWPGFIGVVRRQTANTFEDLRRRGEDFDGQRSQDPQLFPSHAVSSVPPPKSRDDGEQVEINYTLRRFLPTVAP